MQQERLTLRRALPLALLLPLAALALAAADEPVLEQPVDPSVVEPEPIPDLPPPVVPLHLLDTHVLPGSRATLYWSGSQNFSGGGLDVPVMVVHGAQAGPVLCLTAGVHGDEINGVETVRQVVNRVQPEHLAGSVVGVPVVNLFGFQRGSRYLPDRRDLNRFFPGTRQGSIASRIARSFFDSVVKHCDALVDFHTGSFDRANLPQVRADLRDADVVDFSRRFGATVVLHSPGSNGMLRVAATRAGIPAVTFEAGAPARLEPDEIAASVAAVEVLMHNMGMRSLEGFANDPQPIFYESRWVRADHGGLLVSDVRLGQRVRRGQRLGRVIDPLANREHDMVAPFNGRVLGMAQNQQVLPGFAAYHLGEETSEERAVEDAATGRVEVVVEEDGEAPPEAAARRLDPEEDEFE